MPTSCLSTATHISTTWSSLPPFIGGTLEGKRWSWRGVLGLSRYIATTGCDNDDDDDDTDDGQRRANKTQRKTQNNITKGEKLKTRLEDPGETLCDPSLRIADGK